MSKTGIDTTTSRLARPSSSNKVQDLEKKLFSKLDSYEGTSKKTISKRTGKSSKQIEQECSTGTESTPEGYEKMQKCTFWSKVVKPELYSKLVEVKKGNYMGNKV